MNDAQPSCAVCRRNDQLTRVQLADGATATEDDLTTHCRNHMAGYKRPKHYRFVDRFPRTSSGKIRKGELRDHYRAAFDQES